MQIISSRAPFGPPFPVSPQNLLGSQHYIPSPRTEHLEHSQQAAGLTQGTTNRLTQAASAQAARFKAARAQDQDGDVAYPASQGVVVEETWPSDSPPCPPWSASAFQPAAHQVFRGDNLGEQARPLRPKVTRQRT